MAELCRRLYEECGSELFGSPVIGGGLVLAARPDVAHDEGVVLVNYHPKGRNFSLRYRHKSIELEQAESCSEEEVWQRLRLYLGYKLGVQTRRE